MLTLYKLDMAIEWAALIGFQWDSGNLLKSQDKHRVTVREAEEVFLNSPWVGSDLAHSASETRYRALGFTNGRQLLHIAFAIREDRIRVISARPMSRKERKQYEINTQTR